MLVLALVVVATKVPSSAPPALSSRKNAGSWAPCRILNAFKGIDPIVIGRLPRSGLLSEGDWCFQYNGRQSYIHGLMNLMCIVNVHPLRSKLPTNLEDIRERHASGDRRSQEGNNRVGAEQSPGVMGGRGTSGVAILRDG